MNIIVPMTAQRKKKVSKMCPCHGMKYSDVMYVIRILNPWMNCKDTPILYI